MLTLEGGADVITVERYSKYAFKPQHQTHLLEHYDYHVNRFDISEYPEHLRNYCVEHNKEMIEFYINHSNDLEYGVWVFLEGKKRNLLLNHLKEPAPCWKAELPEDTITYFGVNSKIMKLSEIYCDCFIPASQLERIQNVRRYKKSV